MVNKFHQQQYKMAFCLLIFLVLVYMWAPDSKSAVIIGLIGTCSGFMFGKWSNGFRGGYETTAKGRAARREYDAEEDRQADEREQQHEDNGRLVSRRREGVPA